MSTCPTKAIFCEEFLGIAIIPPSFLMISPEKLFFDKNSSIKSKINILQLNKIILIRVLYLI